MLPKELSRGQRWALWSGLGLFLCMVYSIIDLFAGYEITVFVFIWGFGSSYLWAFLWPFIAAGARKWPPVRPWPLFLHLCLSILLGFLGSLFFTGLIYLIRAGYYGLSFDFQIAFPSMISYFFFAKIVFYWAVVAADRAMFYFTAFRREEVRRAELARELSEAQLATLRAQLQPHFLFNTFHGIAALIRTRRNQDALDTLLQLGSLLRFTLDAGRRALIPLAEELSFLQDFMAIEQRRFSDRLRFTKLIQAEAKQALVPAMVLQPLAENAIRHGIEADPEAGRIQLRVWIEGQRLFMELRDDGPGLKRDYREGVGLGHTRRHLLHRYGDEACFEIATQQPKGTRVSVSLPLQWEAPTEKEDAHVSRDDRG